VFADPIAVRAQAGPAPVPAPTASPFPCPTAPPANPPTIVPTVSSGQYPIPGGCFDEGDRRYKFVGDPIAGPTPGVVTSNYPFGTCSLTNLPQPQLTTGTTAPGGGTVDLNSVVGQNAGTPPRLNADGAIVFLIRMRTCELQIERRYADYVRARGGPHGVAQIDYDLQVAHGYCHPPTGVVKFGDRKILRFDVVTSSRPFMSDFNLEDADIWEGVETQYPRAYEMLSFCAGVATAQDAPNSKRLLCVGGGPTAAVGTAAGALIAHNGLSTTLTAVAVLLSSLGSCSGGGSPSGKQSQNTPGAGNNATAAGNNPAKQH
jgi:hypothetical protein